MNTAATPLVSWIRTDGLTATIVGQQCQQCHEIFLERRDGCGNCSGTTWEPRQLAETGTVRAFTIVHRAPAHVSVPYVAVIVDHDGGGTAMANLIEVEPSPDVVRVGTRVRVVPALLATSTTGQRAIGIAYRLVTPVNS